jgi:hypothetical protein
MLSLWSLPWRRVNSIHAKFGEVLRAPILDQNKDYQPLNKKAPNLGGSELFNVLKQDFCGSKGIRTPDPLHAMQVRYRAAPWTHIRLFLFRKGNLNRLLHRLTVFDTRAKICPQRMRSPVGRMA